MESRCALCPGKHLCIAPDGPRQPGGLLFIGEAPGWNEERKDRVFVGKTGEEVDRHYLPLAGLRRENVDFTNAIRCLPVTAAGKLDPSRPKDLALLECCASTHLYPLIERLQPRLLIPLGSFACRAVLGADYNLELGHGFPTESPWGIDTFPMYHPAQGMHEPKKMLYLRTDWDRLRKHLKGRLIVPVDTCPVPDYQEVTDAREILESVDPTRPLAGDTESTRLRQPHCLTYSQAPGQGRLIRAGRVDLLAAFQSKLDTWQSELWFHNWLYDWPVTEAMALRFPHRHIVDTMQQAFHLGNLPQGLKALAFRELGMTMQDFEDVVVPYSRENVLYYYNLARMTDWPKPEEQTTIDEKTGLWKLYKPQGMNTKLKRFFTDYGKSPDKDVFKMWTDNWEADHAMIEAEIGPWPGMCISHVPFEKVLTYACRDADATLRLGYLLRKMRRQVRRFSQELWREKVA